ncbi:MAG: TonB-dependent receptor [Nitrospira sp.]|nr:TonB-dependent receptor [Nitrospira sp.]
MVVVLGLAALLRPLPILAANIVPPAADQVDLAELSLEELMDLPVTSVSKREQPFSQSAAALFVLTQEDIRRSGATSIPEALRMVPGLQVAKIDSNKWAISARGFNGRFANKLLVLIDGRTVYTPTFAGVYWDVQDTLLEDIERIEVIRGPGATLWGSNAVNGVINVITKKAKDTQGGLFVGGAGTEERGFTGMRYGAALSDDTHLRVYGKFFARDDQATRTGDPATDRWQQGRAGMRMDHTANNGDAFTLQGDYYSERYRENTTLPILTTPFTQAFDFKALATGGNLLGRWTHKISPTSGLILQAYYDRLELDNGRQWIKTDTADINFQHHAALGVRQNVIWGLGYRFVNNLTDNSSDLLGSSYNPKTRFFSLWSGFIQDDITLIPQQVTLTLGTKVEHNDFTGFVVQPSIKLRWTPTERQTVWTAVSRAIRTPSVAEDDVRVNQPTGRSPLVAVMGDRGFGNEQMMAYEAGYRNQITPALSLDLATFYNNYKDLRTFEPGPTFTETAPAPSHTVLPLNVSNKLRAETYGIEASLEWRPVEWWRIQPSYTYLYMHLYTDRSNDTGAGNATGENPAHQISLRSLMSLPHRTEFDLWARYVDRLPGIQIPSYVTLDARLGWKPTARMEISLVGQNLLDPHRPEFRERIVSFTPTEIQRGVYGKVTWRW